MASKCILIAVLAAVLAAACVRADMPHPRWTNLDLTVNQNEPLQSTMYALTGSQIYLLTNGSLKVVNLSNGSVDWELPVFLGSYSRPMVFASPEVVVVFAQNGPEMQLVFIDPKLHKINSRVPTILNVQKMFWFGNRFVAVGFAGFAAYNGKGFQVFERYNYLTIEKFIFLDCASVFENNLLLFYKDLNISPVVPSYYNVFDENFDLINTVNATSFSRPETMKCNPTSAGLLPVTSDFGTRFGIMNVKSGSYLWSKKYIEEAMPNDFAIVDDVLFLSFLNDMNNNVTEVDLLTGKQIASTSPPFTVVYFGPATLIFEEKALFTHKAP